jgi:hypothetical protein
MPSDTSQAGGVTIANNRDGGVRVSVTRTCRSRAIDEDIPEWVEGQNRYCFDMTCKATLSCFMSWPKAMLSSMEHITLTPTMMASDDGDNYGYAEDLARKLQLEVVLDSITLAVPHDNGVLDIQSDESEWWMWTLHQGAIEGFKEGRIRRVRFLHRMLYTTVRDVKKFRAYEEIRLRVVGQEYEDWHTEYVKAILRKGWEENAMKEMQDQIESVWEGLKYSIEIDERREDEEGTVLVLRHR